MPPTERRWPERDPALFVQVGQAVQVEVAVEEAGLGDHQVALRPLAHHPHGSGVEQVAQAVGGHGVGLEPGAGRGQVDRGQHLEHVGLLAGLDPGPAGGPAAQAGQQAGQEQQHHRGHLLGRVDLEVS